MSRFVPLLALLMVVIVVGIDVFFLRKQFGLRLAVNIAVVLIFVLLYFVLLRR